MVTLENRANFDNLAGSYPTRILDALVCKDGRSSPRTIFVRLPSKQTVPIHLQGFETVSDLVSLVSQKFPSNLASQRLILTHSGHVLTDNVAAVKAFDTIQASFALLGGSNPAPLDEKALAAQQQDPNLQPSTSLVPEPNDDDLWQEITVILGSGADAQEYKVIADCSFNDFLTNVKTNFANPKDKTKYNYTFFFSEEDTDNRVQTKWNVPERERNKLLSQLLADKQSKKIMAKRAAQKALTPRHKFLEPIPEFQLQVGDRMIQSLCADGGDDGIQLGKSMTGFVKQSLEEEDIKKWLQTLTLDQKEIMLIRLQKDHPDEILTYLLHKSGQWTEISEAVNKLTTKRVKNLMIGRLINNKASTFTMDEEADEKFIVQLLKNEKSIQRHLWNEMQQQPEQILELFLSMLKDTQTPKVIDALKVKQKNIIPFWESLSKENRLRIWANLDNATRLALFVDNNGEEAYLNSDQRMRLWDNIGRDNRLEFWRSLQGTDAQSFLFQELTCQQQVRLWSNLGKVFKDENLATEAFDEFDREKLQEERDFEQNELLKTIESWAEDQTRQIWNVMSHVQRSRMLTLMKDDVSRRQNLFRKLDYDNKTLMTGMLNQEEADELTEILNPTEKAKFFFNQHFNMKEETEIDRAEFVNGLLSSFYENYNQFQPFAKLENGFTQCIPDPEVQNGYITVQIIDPVAPTQNSTYKVNQDEDLAEYQGDEARANNASKAVKNDQYRLVQNRYGHLEEQEPNYARNADQLGIISFWEFTHEKGFWCSYSFYVSNPCQFKVHEESVSKLVLHTGRNGEVFFFNQKEIVSQKGATKRKKHDLCLQILYKSRYSQQGEYSREVQENCHTYRLKQGSNLYDFVIGGSFVAKDYNNIYFLNSVPTIITHPGTDDQYLVYSKCSIKDPGPATYFYDLKEHATVARICGAEVFLDYYPDPDEQKVGHILYLSNTDLYDDNYTSWDKPVVKQTVVDFQAKTQVDFADKSTVFGLKINLPEASEHYRQQDVIEREESFNKYKDFLEIDKSGEESKNTNKGKLQKPTQNHSGVEIKIHFDKDLQTLDKWKFRYLRDSPLFVYPHERRKDTGFTETFTLVLQNNFSFTFAMSDPLDQLEAQARKLKQQEELKAPAKEEVIDPKDVVELTPEEIAAQQEEEQKRREEEEREREQNSSKSFGTLESEKIYRAVYYVPDAQYVVEDKRHRVIKGKIQESRILVQVLSRDDQRITRDRIKDGENPFSVVLYPINMKQKGSSTKTTIPSSSAVYIKITKEAMSSYLDNNYGGKFGNTAIKALATPLIFSKEGVIGSFFYTEKLISVDQTLIQWFAVQQPFKQEDKIQRPVSQNIVVDYPLLMYRGFAPDNRELVLGNLADKQQPQKIIHLNESQFICFVGHNFSSREAKIGYLAAEGNFIKLCWFVCIQPFEKKEFNQYQDYEIQEVEISLDSRILQNIEKIQKVEFIQADVHDEYGALFIQTQDSVYFQNNFDGYFKELTSGQGDMVKLNMLRGFNDQFYFVETFQGGSDQILKEVSANMSSDGWHINIRDIFKVNEGAIVAFEMDPENCSYTDSIYTYDRTLVIREGVINYLYVIDDSENLHKLEEPKDNYAKYNVIETRNLSALKGFSNQIVEFKAIPFNSLSISNRVLTINEVNYNLTNNTKWPLSVVTTESKDKDLEEVDSDLSEHDEDEIKDTNTLLYKIHSVRSVRWTQRQLFHVTFIDAEDAHNPNAKRAVRDQIITKLLPGSRRQDLVGLRGMRDMDSINFIDDDHYLVKFRSSLASGKQDYWSIIDKFGQICPIPKLCKNQLTWYNYSAGAVEYLPSGCLLVLRGGFKPVLSISTDVAIQEYSTTMVEFSRKGEAMLVQSYDRRIYLDQLKETLRFDLLEDDSSLTIFIQNKLSSAQKKQRANRTIDSFKLSDTIHVSKEGDLYRIATVVHRDFDDAVAVNVYSRENREELKGDKLWAGLYVVQPQIDEQETQNVPLKRRDKDLKILVLLTKSEKDRDMVERAGFTVVGHHLCWQYPSRTAINLLDMSKMNEIAVKEVQAKRLSKSATRAVTAKLRNVALQDVPFGESLLLQDDQTKSPFDVQTTPFLKPNKLTQQQKSQNLKIKRQQHFKSASANFSKRLVNKQNALEELPFYGEIWWSEHLTKTIDLSTMMSEEDDSKNTMLLEVPNSLQFSVIKSKDNDGNLCYDLNGNLLQVGVSDRIILFDLSQKVPREIFFLNATNQFIDPMSYVDAGIQMQFCYEDPTKRKDGHLFNYVVSNRDKNECLLRQDRVFPEKTGKTKKSIEDEYANLPKTPVCLGSFRKYAEADLVELKRLNSVITQNKRLVNIDFQTAVSMFEGHSIFSIFHDSIKLHEEIFQQLEEGEWPSEVQNDESEIQNNVLRRLYRILTQPTPDMVQPVVKLTVKKQKTVKEGEAGSAKKINRAVTMKSRNQVQNEPNEDENTVEEKEQVVQESETSTSIKEDQNQGLNSTLKKSLYIEQSVIRDLLMSIANMCEECKISDFAASQDHMAILLENLSANFIELVRDSFVYTTFTKKIANTRWANAQDLQMITFLQQTSILTEEECDKNVVKKLRQEYAVNDDDLSRTQVDVRMLKIDWLLADKKNFVNFVYILQKSSNDKIYQTELLDVLLAEFWNKNYRKIMELCLIPWLFFFLSTMYFFMSILKEGARDFASSDEKINEYVLGGIILVSLAYQFYIEIIQARRVPFFDYVFANLTDILSYSGTLLIMVCQLLELDFLSGHAQRLIAAFVLLLLWFKVFGWLRLFNNFAFYVRLIQETFIDIRYFTLIFLVALAMFGCSMYMMQLNKAGEDEEDIVAPFFDFFAVDLIVNQYFLALGEFTMDGFDAHPEMMLCYTFFLLATFATQITFLNMLVAIMGDTYGRVVENQAQTRRITLLEIMGDYTAVIEDRNAAQQYDSYLFVVKPKDDSSIGGADAWEGDLGLIRKTVERNIAVMKEELIKDLKKVNVQNLESKARDQTVEREVKNQYTRIGDRFTSLSDRTEETNYRFQRDIEQELKQVKEKQKQHFEASRQTHQVIQDSQDGMFSDLKRFITGSAGRLGSNVQAPPNQADDKSGGQAGNNSAPAEFPEEAKAEIISKIDALQTKISNQQDQLLRMAASGSSSGAPVRPQSARAGADPLVNQNMSVLSQRQEALDKQVAEIQQQIDATQEKVRSSIEELRQRQQDLEGLQQQQERVVTTATAALQPQEQVEEDFTGIRAEFQRVLAQMTEQQTEFQTALIQQQNNFQNELLQQQSQSVPEQQPVAESSQEVPLNPPADDPEQPAE